MNKFVPRLRTVMMSGLLLLAIPAMAFTQQKTVGSIVRIEQDWEIQIETPHPNEAIPAIELALLPDPVNMPELGSLLQLNFRGNPEPIGGGVQLQIVQGDSVVNTVSTEAASRLKNKFEKITLTTYSSLNTKTKLLEFGVSKASSLSFPTIGNGALKTSLTSNLTSLDNYNTADTVFYSGVIYGNTRVRYLRVLEVRKYDAKGFFLTEGPTDVYVKTN